MFETLEMAPPDPIIGLTEAFVNDPNPGKINLGTGVYKDGDGNTPILPPVKEAETRILKAESTKNYLPIDGSPQYVAIVQRLLFGNDHEVVATGRAATAHTPGGTGALRVAADFLKKIRPDASLWLSDPTWPNHPKVFAAAGVTTRTFPYFNAVTNDLAFSDLMAVLRGVPAGDVVLLHGCCHNPSGIDPDPLQWKQIGDVLEERNVLPLVDFAYQGFAAGLWEDAAGLLELTRPGRELMVCSSFSKNFGLYNERVGALTVVTGSSDAAGVVISHIKTCIRANYSNPPTHGASIVTVILGDEALRSQWKVEVGAMRDRINGMRTLYVETLAAKGVKTDFSFVSRQKGMFSFSGLNRDQVRALRAKHSIYIVDSGRINVAGLTGANLDRFCSAVAEVLGS